MPRADPGQDYRRHRAAVDEAVTRVLGSGRYVLGPEVELFEREFAAYAGVAHGCAVASGTDAIELALRGCGVGPGDAVVTVSHTAVATVAAIERAGATPLFVDIDPCTYTVDPCDLERALGGMAWSHRVKAVLVVHLYGRPCDMGAVTETAARYGLDVVEDCAQAHGASWEGRMVGSIGRAAAFSFYPTKNLAALGDAGMVVTNDAEVDGTVRVLRQYGWDGERQSRRVGSNSRMDELQAAVLRARLPQLSLENARRAEVADAYGAALAEVDVQVPEVPATWRHAFHQYVVRTPHRDGLRARLVSDGIDAFVLYPVPVHHQPAYEGRVPTAGPLCATEQVSREVLSLPMGNHLSDDDVSRVTSSVLSWARRA